MIQVALLMIFKCVFWYLHPFHLSICDIEHDADTQSLQITSRLFQDDFELAMNQLNSSRGYFDEFSESRIETDLQDFFGKHLTVSIDDRSRSLKFLGFEIEDNVVWCYLEIGKVNSIGEITLSYTALLDTFDDQINLAHIRYRGKVKSLKFQRGQISGKANFSN